MAGGFRVLGPITRRLFPKGDEKPQTIGRDVKPEPKSGTRITGWSQGAGEGRKKGQK